MTTVATLAKSASCLLLAVTAACSGNRGINNDYDAVARQCGSGLAPAAGARVVQIVTPAQQLLTVDQIAALSASLRVHGDAEDRPVAVTAQGCLAVPPPPAAAELRLSLARDGLALRIDADQIQADQLRTVQRLALAPVDAPVLQLDCGDSGILTNGAFDVVFTPGSTASLTAARTRLALVRRSDNADVATLLDKPAGVPASRLGASGDGSALPSGDYYVRAEMEDQLGRILRLSSPGLCPVTLDKDAPGVAGAQADATTPVYVTVGTALDVKASAGSTLRVCTHPVSAAAACTDADFATVTDIVMREAGAFTVSFFAEDAAGNRSARRNLTVNVDAATPDLSLRWTSDAISGTPPSLTRSVTKLSAEALGLVDDTADAGFLASSLACRTRLLVEGGFERAFASALCASGRCDGKPLETFTPCDPQMQITFMMDDVLERDVGAASLVLEVRATDTVGRSVIRALPLWIARKNIQPWESSLHHMGSGALSLVKDARGQIWTLTDDGRLTRHGDKLQATLFGRDELELEAPAELHAVTAGGRLYVNLGREIRVFAWAGADDPVATPAAVTVTATQLGFRDGEHVRKLVADGTGEVWALTNLSRLFHGRDGPWSETDIGTLDEPAEGLASRPDGGVYVIDALGVTAIPSMARITLPAVAPESRDEFEDEDEPLGVVTSLFADSHGRLWLGADDGRVFVHEAGALTERSATLELAEPEARKGTLVSGFVEDAAGHVHAIVAIYGIYERVLGVVDMMAAAPQLDAVGGATRLASVWAAEYDALGRLLLAGPTPATPLRGTVLLVRDAGVMTFGRAGIDLVTKAPEGTSLFTGETQLARFRTLMQYHRLRKDVGLAPGPAELWGGGWAWGDGKVVASVPDGASADLVVTKTAAKPGGDLWRLDYASNRTEHLATLTFKPATAAVDRAGRLWILGARGDVARRDGAGVTTFASVIPGVGLDMRLISTVSGMLATEPDPDGGLWQWRETTGSWERRDPPASVGNTGEALALDDGRLAVVSAYGAAILDGEAWINATPADDHMTFFPDATSPALWSSFYVAERPFPLRVRTGNTWTDLTTDGMPLTWFDSIPLQTSNVPHPHAFTHDAAGRAWMSVGVDVGVQVNGLWQALGLHSTAAVGDLTFKRGDDGAFWIVGEDQAYRWQGN